MFFNSRECVKLALVYVAHGQEDERSILGNSEGSLAYREFALSLGWEVLLFLHLTSATSDLFDFHIWLQLLIAASH